MFSQMRSLVVRDLKHWYRSEMEIILLIMLPVIMLALFGQAFGIIGNFITPGDLSGAPDYVSFMSIGLLGMTTMMTCMFSTIAIVLDRQSGFLKKVMVAPIRRDAIAFSRMLSIVIKAMAQTLIMFCIALSFTLIPGLTGLTLKSGFGVIDLLGMLLISFLLAWIFSSLLVTMSLAIERPETMLGLINLINMPLMFVSAILFPTILMPDWLKILSNSNPLTWAADAMRQFAFVDQAPIYDLWFDILMLAVFSIFTAVISLILSRKLLSNK
jgi:ABC-2 type transport system permease protein